MQFSNCFIEQVNLGMIAKAYKVGRVHSAPQIRSFMFTSSSYGVYLYG